jgi:hypothetical protein
MYVCYYEEMNIIKSNIWVVNEYEFSIMSAWRNHNQKLPYDSGGATRIGSSVRGGRETDEAGAWFSSYLHLYNLKFFWLMQLQ